METNFKHEPSAVMPILMRHFIKFLKENNIYISFRSYISEKCYLDAWEQKVNPSPSFFYLYPITLNKDIKGDAFEYMRRIIFDSFCWSSTKKGASFWDGINRKWRTSLKTLEAKNDTMI